MANLLTSPFEGLTAADFQVYDRPCWSNNQFNLGRMRAKERMLQLAAPLAALPGAAGLELRATSEVPGLWNGRSVQDQWVYLVRDAAARQRLGPVLADRMALAVSVRDPAEHHQHAVVFVRLHLGGLEVGFSLNANAGVDRDHLAAVLSARPDAAKALLAALPEAFTLDDVPPSEGLDTAFDAAFAALVAGERAELRISARLDRAVAEAAGVHIGDRIVPLVEALLPLFALAAWSETNDGLGMGARLADLDRRRAESAATRAEAETLAERQRAERTVAAQARSVERAESDAAWRRRMAEARAARPPEPAPAPAAVAERPALPARPVAAERPARVDNPTRAEKPTRAEVTASGDPAEPVVVAVGDRVRLGRGLLAGKDGVVTADSGKGYFKVKVGTLEVQVLGTELVKS